MLHPKLLLIILLLSASAHAQTFPLQYIETHTDASYRGLSVADDKAVWVSGSKGWVGRTVDGGTGWTFAQVKGFETCDFRTLYAFDSSTAIIANAGSPAYILRTTDGGRNWTKVYENRDSAAFIDGVDFWAGGGRRHGVMHGDPIGRRMLLLYTHDRGQTWREAPERSRPRLAEGEASFAASGTSIRCLLHGTVLVATGGRVSHLFLSRNRGHRWRSIATPMLSGSQSTGTYTVMAGRSAERWRLAGGDYLHDTVRTANFYYSTNKGKLWQAPAITTRGYRECLAMVDVEPYAKRNKARTMFALGPSGIDISTDDGVNWKALNDEKGFHVMKPSKDNSRLFLAGSNGKLAVMWVGK
jgi:photosystem II stability/assembly factor-like uncharacterized protein